jgi:alpha-tubulin suppressor-like RCC1 family protein
MKRGVCFAHLVVATFLWTLTGAQAQQTATNLADLAEQAFSSDHSFYLPWTPWEWRAYSLDSGQPWWVDCSQLPCVDLFQASTNLSTRLQINDVQFVSVLLTKNVLTGEMTLQADGSTNVLAVIAAPSDYQPGAQLGQNTWLWQEWQQMTNCPDCWGIEGEIPPPIITLKALLADINDNATYEDNAGAQTTDAMTASAASIGGRFTPMDDESGDGGGSGNPCTLTNLLQTFAVTNITRTANGISITFQSCQFSRYLIFTASQLSSNIVWFPQAYVWGAPGHSSTTWTDTSTTNTDGSAITRRFYRVQRLLGSPIAAGGNHTLAVTPDRKLWSWGSNGDGQLSDSLSDDLDFDSDRPYPGEAADPTSCTGQFITNAVALAGGGNEFTIVADVNGTVWAAGEDFSGEQGGAPGHYYNSDHYPATPISNVSNIVNVAAGYSHVLALRADGAVFAWGSDSDENGNLFGQLGVGGLPSPYYTSSPTQSLVTTLVVAITAGAYHSAASDSSGNAWVWGRGWEGQIGNGGTANANVPTMLTTISNVIAIVAGYRHTIALTADKTCWTWGDNSEGELGRTNVSFGFGSYDASPGQIPPSILSNVVAIAAGVDFSLAVTGDGRLFSWGDGSAGELGVSGISSTNIPIQVPGISNVVLVSTTSGDPISQDSEAERHVVAMTLDPVDGTGQTTNRYWGWGANFSGEVGGATNANVVYTPIQSQFCTRCQRHVQLGTSGSFTAQCNGTLYLYFNDDQTAFGDNSGSFTATVDGFAPVAVYANNASGVAAGPITSGSNYTFSASGTCFHSQSQFSGSDANGNDASNTLWNCSDFSIINKTNTVCPTAQCFSLVGRIQ